MMHGLIPLLPNPGRAIARNVRSRPDSEFEQASLRAAIMLLVYGYFFYLFTFGETDLGIEVRQHILHVFGPIFMASSFVLLALIAIDRNISPLRRLAGAVIDIFSCSYFLYLSNEAGTILLVVYLWVTLGNGFRYGLKYLVFSASISILGFSLVMWMNPFWQQHMWLGTSMMLMLVLIPVYAGFLIQKLHKAVKQAHEASLAKSSFLANMSHELRTPLNGVIGIADLLRETPLNKEQQELTQAIHASAMTLHKLIENVLDISRIEAGKLTSFSEDYDLHQLLNTMAVMLEPQAHRKGLMLAVHIAPRTPYLLHGDVQHLRQVLVNLIGNAIKFTEHGQVDIYVRPFTENKQTWLRLEVADTGIGIPAEKQRRIFEIFTQADASITRRYGGTGLGTSISKQLVEMMGGRIGLASQPGQGTTFWFELPVQEQKLKPAQERLPAQLRVGLLVSPELGYRLGELIRKWDGEVIPMSGQAGAVLHLMAEAGNAQDAMVVERGLLGDDPAHFVKLLHDSPGLGHFPVILIDPDASGQQDDAWMRSGFSAVLQTPVNPTLLFSALHEAASHREYPDNVVSLAEHFQAKAGRTRLRILVAEDNPINQRVMRGLLEHAGHEVVIAGDGEDALTLLESNAGNFSLAIMDMHMPVLSGPEAVKRWRFMESGHLPIIMLTADARSEAEQQCRDSGADDFLTKPVNSRDLLDKVAQLALSGKSEGKSAGRRQKAAVVLDETVLKDLDEFGGGPDFVRDLIEEFRQDSDRTLQATRQALEDQNYGIWKDHLHMLKGGASDVGAVAMAEACAEAELIKPFEITQPLAAERLAAVHAAQQAVLAAMKDFLARQQSARGM